MARITRKELKSDNIAEFAQKEVGLTVTFFEEHQKDVVRYGGIGIAVVLLVAGFFIYQKHERAARQQELGQAIRIQESAVSSTSASGGNTFPTQDSKDQAAIKAFTDLQRKHSGSNEADIAEYYLGAIAADQGKLPEAEKHFQLTADHADKNYASLAMLSLSQVYFSENKAADGEKLLRDLMASPTIFVSKDQAALALAQHYVSVNNTAEARKLLSPIKDGKSQVATIAQTMYAQLPPQ